MKLYATPKPNCLNPHKAFGIVFSFIQINEFNSDISGYRKKG